MHSEAVVFENRDGQRLFGILHEPGNGRTRDVGIILLSPGVKMRVAPHRLYNLMAARYVEMGFPVLRFDFWGLGDSEGEVREELLADLYGHVQVGRYVGDTQSAMDWMSQHCGVDRFVVGGLCGGAITGLLAGARDRRVQGLIGLGIPVILDSANIDKTRYLTSGQLDRLRAGYLRKLIDPKSWLRLLSFKSDYRVLWRALAQPLRSRLRRRQPAPASEPPAAENFNTLFPGAFFSMAESRRPIYLMFSGADRLLWEYEEKFAQPYAERLRACQDGFEVHTIKEANHILSTAEARAEMLSRTADWLERRFPSPAPARSVPMLEPKVHEGVR